MIVALIILKSFIFVYLLDKSTYEPLCSYKLLVNINY